MLNSLISKIIYLSFINFNDPLEQFSVISVAYSNTWSIFNLTNSTIFFFNIFFIFFILIFMSSTKTNNNVINWFYENLFLLVKDMFKKNLLLERSEYFSILFFLFIFIFISNLFGLIPLSFTLTSSFIVTFFLAFSHFSGIVLIGLNLKRWKLAQIFLPSGVPYIISTLLIPIEIISFIARIFSLSIRLFANMMSGHALLKILIGFAWTLTLLGNFYILAGLLPWIIVTLIMFLELLIAFLQAYVFVILIILYFNDILSDH